MSFIEIAVTLPMLFLMVATCLMCLATILCIALMPGLLLFGLEITIKYVLRYDIDPSVLSPRKIFLTTLRNTLYIVLFFYILLNLHYLPFTHISHLQKNHTIYENLIEYTHECGSMCEVYNYGRGCGEGKECYRTTPNEEYLPLLDDIGVRIIVENEQTQGRKVILDNQMNDSGNWQGHGTDLCYDFSYEYIPHSTKWFDNGYLRLIDNWYIHYPLWGRRADCTYFGGKLMGFTKKSSCEEKYFVLYP